MPEHEEAPQPTAPKQDIPKQTTTFALSDKQIKRFWTIAGATGKSEDAINEWIKKHFNKDSVKDLSKAEYDKACDALEKAKKSA